jgi:uncharacterized membrane protein
MKIFNIILVAITAFVMGAGALLHFADPQSLVGFIFPPLPPLPTIYLAGAVQLIIAIAVIVPKTRALGGLAFAALCLAYMPLHIWDLFRDDPIIAPMVVAAIRVVVQILFIWIGYVIWQGNKSQT